MICISDYQNVYNVIFKKTTHTTKGINQMPTKYLKCVLLITKVLKPLTENPANYYYFYNTKGTYTNYSNDIYLMTHWHDILMFLPRPKKFHIHTLL